MGLLVFLFSVVAIAALPGADAMTFTWPDRLSQGAGDRRFDFFR
jgi:hypothetical protein